MPLYRGEYIPNVKALPPASADYRGMQLRVPGGFGVEDVVAVCVRGADGTHYWRRLIGPGLEFNVEDYGSVQAALDAAGDAGGGVVVADRGSSYAQTTTVTVPADVTLSGVVMTFTGTPDAGLAAVQLDGEFAAIEDCTVTVSSGRYFRTIRHAASSTFSRRNRIHVATTDLVAGEWHDVFFTAATSPTTYTGIIIEQNDVTADGVYQIMGVSSQHTPGIQILHNHWHDWENIVDPLSGWAVYLSVGCFGGLIEGNRAENLPCKGFRNSNLTGTLADDYGRRIINNVCRDVAVMGISTTSVHAAEVAGNVVSGCDYAYYLDGEALRVHHNHAESMVYTANDSNNSLRPFYFINAPDSVFDHNTIGVRGDAYLGVQIAADRVVCDGNLFLSGRPRSAYRVESGADDVQIRGGVIHESDDSTTSYSLLTAGANTTIDGVRIKNPAVSGWIGVQTSAATDPTIHNNRITGGTHGVWIPAGTTSGARIEGNQIDSTTGAAINNSGTGSTIRRNSGYVTENSGVTSVADGGTISHGLATTPTKYGATPTVSGELVSITSVSSTTLTVAIKKNDGTAGTTQNIAWWAEV